MQLSDKIKHALQYRRDMITRNIKVSDTNEIPKNPLSCHLTSLNAELSCDFEFDVNPTGSFEVKYHAGSNRHYVVGEQ
jgi:hypothetical protein